jgi:HEAT repeat protein
METRQGLIPIATLALASIFPSCQGSTVITTKGDLPSAPYTHLTNTSLGLREDIPLIVSHANLQETLLDIKKLQAYANRPSYRSHLETLSSEVFQKIANGGDLDATIMTLMATTACHHPISYGLAQQLLRHPHPIVQLCAVQALSQINSSFADQILIEALRSDFPIIRLEAAYKIACKRGKDSFFHLDALSYKLPEPLLPYLPELFAIEGSSQAMTKLRHFLYSKDEEIVIHSLLAIGRQHLSEFSDTLLAFDPHSPSVVEALAFALRAADQTKAIDRLKKLLLHPNSCVQIQSALSLAFLGETSYQDKIIQLAEQGNLFALFALSECPHAHFFTLHEKSKSFAINKALAMLRQKDTEAVGTICNLLSSDEDKVIYMSPSSGYTSIYWDIAPLHSFEADQRPVLFEQSLSYKEEILSASLELSEEAFFTIASYVFDNEIIPLYPCLIGLLKNQESDLGIALLEKEANAIGRPYNRAFAQLALFQLRSSKDEESLQKILDFARQKPERPWRFPVPWASFARQEDRGKEQQTNASARLYIETLQTLSEASSQKSINILVAELSQAQTPYVPFICAALLHATL